VLREGHGPASAPWFRLCTYCCYLEEPRANKPAIVADNNQRKKYSAATEARTHQIGVRNDLSSSMVDGVLRSLTTLTNLGL
jgi:hypothetical protein